jgi:hypothetical protein
MTRIVLHAVKGKVELGHVFDIHIRKIKMKRVSQCIHFEEIYTLETVTVSPGFLFSGSHNTIAHLIML